MTRNYGGIIWTNHALERLQERGISQSDAYFVFTKPDQTRYAESQGGWVYYKTIRNEMIEVVGKQNEKKEWIILTAWSKPADQNSYHKKHKEQPWFLRFLKRLLFGWR